MYEAMQSHHSFATKLTRALFCIAALMCVPGMAARSERAIRTDAATASPGPYSPAPTHAGHRIQSLLLPMRDGVRLAVDVALPETLAAGERLPAILHQTRYWRRIRLRGLAELVVDPLASQGRLGAIKQRFLAQGYAWVDVDTRGSGASFGSRPWDFSPDEIQDGAEVVSWIVAQPWSNGRVGAAGASYSGTAAEFLLVNRHPALKAVATLLAEFDQYAHILAPGGVPLTFYFDAWGRVTGSLDRGALPSPDWVSRVFVEGVAPADEDPGGELRAAAIAQHADNYDFRVLSGITFRDDLPFSESDMATPAQRRALSSSFAWLAHRFGPRFRARGVDLASTHAYAEDLRAANTPVYAYSGWLDYAGAAISRFRASAAPGSKLTLGPWDHALHNVSPGGPGGTSAFDHTGELLKFFDRHLKGLDTGIDREPPVHYFTMGAESWRSAASWPPAAATRDFHLGSGVLATEPPAEVDASDERAVDFDAGAGRRTRWDVLLGGSLPPLGSVASDRSPPLIAYESAPLAEPLELTGAPRLFLWVSSTASDGAFFATLEDVTADGRVIPLTEGQLRALQRRLAEPPRPGAALARSFRRADAQPLIPGEPAELVFDLEPTSYRFAAGHRVRLSLAGAERDHFARVPAAGEVRLRLHRDRLHPSRLELPIAPQTR